MSFTDLAWLNMLGYAILAAVVVVALILLLLWVLRRK